MNRLKTKRRNISWGVKDKNGKILTSKDEILERQATFYEELYDDPKTCVPLPPDTENPIPSILKSEVVSAIENLSSGKSPGIDSICTEFLKAGGDAMAQVLTKLFNLILGTGEIPSNFKKALIVVLFKKDDSSECKVLLGRGHPLKAKMDNPLPNGCPTLGSLHLRGDFPKFPRKI